MQNEIIAAAFNDRRSAGSAVDELRRIGIPDKAISVVSRHQSGDADLGQDRPDSKASGAVKGLGIGAGVGAVFGFAALAIPGAGPIIAAGALAETLGVVGFSAASGAVVGGMAGGTSRALMDYGVRKEDADYYARRVHDGAFVVLVDKRGVAAHEGTIRHVLKSAGGETSSSEQPVAASC